MGDVVHKGGCHCGRIEFEVRAPADLEVTQCNCSICSMTGFLHLFVGRDAFRLLRGEGVLTTYTFNTGVAQHHFCRYCGVKSWYVPRSHPDGVSVNVNCLHPETIAAITTPSFDGRNWEQNIAQLSPISD
jgi:hypothetical protein